MSLDISSSLVYRLGCAPLSPQQVERARAEFDSPVGKYLFAKFVTSEFLNVHLWIVGSGFGSSLDNASEHPRQRRSGKED